MVTSLMARINKIKDGELNLHIDAENDRMVTTTHTELYFGVIFFTLTKEQIIQLGKDIIAEAEKE